MEQLKLYHRGYKISNLKKKATCELITWLFIYQHNELIWYFENTKFLNRLSHPIELNVCWFIHVFIQPYTYVSLSHENILKSIVSRNIHWYQKKRDIFDVKHRKCGERGWWTTYSTKYTTLLLLLSFYCHFNPQHNNLYIQRAIENDPNTTHI